MQIHVQQVPVKGLVEWLSEKVWQIGQTQGHMAGHCHQVPEPIYVPPWSNQNYSVAQVVLHLLHHFAQDVDRWEDIWVQITLNLGCQGMPKFQSGSGLELQVELVTYEVKNLFWIQF